MNTQSNSTKQPTWKLKAQLGDVSPIEYGGYFVYEDETGVYAPEAELLIPPAELETGEGENEQWTVYRFILEPCTFINGILSDNKFHPEHAAWFAKDLKSVSDFIGMALDELVLCFLSNDLSERAHAWRAIGEYHGFDNLDSYPLHFNKSEIEERYND